MSCNTNRICLVLRRHVRFIFFRFRCRFGTGFRLWLVGYAIFLTFLPLLDLSGFFGIQRPISMFVLPLHLLEIFTFTTNIPFHHIDNKDICLQILWHLQHLLRQIANICQDKQNTICQTHLSDTLRGLVEEFHKSYTACHD